jgi:DNA-directed RNA polymerases I, II, and III subunit RPABC3
VFKIVNDRSSTPPRVEAYASFGGLLMLLKGEVTALKDLEEDMRLYILIRRI